MNETQKKKTMNSLDVLFTTFTTIIIFPTNNPLSDYRDMKDNTGLSFVKEKFGIETKLTHTHTHTHVLSSILLTSIHGIIRKCYPIPYFVRCRFHNSKTLFLKITLIKQRICLIYDLIAISNSQNDNIICEQPHWMGN